MSSFPPPPLSLTRRRIADTAQTTVNLKKVELPVKQIVSGKKIKASGTLANPESLKYYEQFANVEEVLAQTKGQGALRAKSKL
jgi:acetoacetyl-CoA synthetase